MGTYQNGTFNIISSDTTADFTKYVYSAVYFNSGGTYVINGISVIGVAGEQLDIIVDEDTTTLAAGFLLLGNVRPSLPKTGKISGSTYQWVDIKTGLPIQQS